MYKITDTQIDLILNDISARGVEMESLQQNLLDHICCIIEKDLEENGDFESFYQKTIKTFYKDALWEIEEETIQLLTFKNYYTMKKIMIGSGIFSAITMIIGMLFKIMHWQGTSLIIVLGIFSSSLIFLPLMFTLKVKEKQSTKEKLVLALATVLGILISISILFKVMHWPGANIMGGTFLAVATFVYIPVYFFTGIRNPDLKVNTIVTTVLMVMGCGLLFTLVNTRPQIQEKANLVANSNLQESYKKITGQANLISTALLQDTTLKDKKEVAEIIQKCNVICDNIEQIKLLLINKTWDADLKTVDYNAFGRLDNYDIPTQILFKQDQTTEPALVLVKMKEDLKSLISLSGKEQSDPGLIDLSDKKDPLTNTTTSWEVENFYRTPLICVLRNLTQLQLNIRFIEMNCIK